MKKIIILILALTARFIPLSAQITQEQADAIVLAHLQNEAAPPFLLYVNVSAPSSAGIAVTTSNGETVKAKYACRTYYLNESGLSRSRYLFVKEDSGSLLEVIAENDLGPADAASWKIAGTGSGLPGQGENNILTIYPNPADNWLTIPFSEKFARVEIYDLKGGRLFSARLSEDGRLDVSFLNTGVYMLHVSGETYKIIKN